MKCMKLFRLILLAAALQLSALAAPITFTSTGTGTGSIGATNFTDANFVITAIGDTTARQDLGGGVFVIFHTSAQIDISGVGVFDFITGTRTFVNQGAPIVGFSRASGLDLLNGPNNAAFSSWDMLTSIGPINGTANLLQWGSSPVDTSGGVLSFSDGSSATSFTATVGEVPGVPEPSTWTLLLGGMVLAGAIRRRNTKS